MVDQNTRRNFRKRPKLLTCQKAGENLYFIRKQDDFGKLPEPKVPNEELSFDYAGSFQNAYKQNAHVKVDRILFWDGRMPCFYISQQRKR